MAVNGVRHPVRDDFATFNQDALAGRIALLATTIADAFWTTHAARLHEVLAAAFGEDAPPTRAAVGSSLCCLYWQGDDHDGMRVLRRRGRRLALRPGPRPG